MEVKIALKKVREAKGLSQNDHARVTGYSPQHIQKFEQNRAKSFTLEALAKFCDALGCLPGDLFDVVAGDEPEKQAKNRQNKKESSTRKNKTKSQSSQITNLSMAPKRAA